MILPPKPANEAARISQLKRLQILDTPVEERFDRVTRILSRALDVPIAAVSLVDEERQWFKSVQGLNVCETCRDQAFCAHAILQEEPLIVPDATKDSRFEGNPLVTGDPHIRFYAGWPLIVDHGICLGTLCAIDVKPRKLDASQLKILKDLAKIIETELSLISLSEAHSCTLEELEEAQRAALVDPLTRAWNRRGGEKLLKREWDTARRNSNPVGIAVLDIDHFKTINDGFGHEAGDQVLKQVATAILRELRPNDVLCRWGGEEFLIVLSGCDESLLHAPLNRIMKSLSECNEGLPDALSQVTASIGATSTYPDGSDTIAATIQCADTAMYRAKQQGRNQFLIAAEPGAQKIA